MGAPKKEVKKIRNTFTLSTEAQVEINKIDAKYKSRTVSEAIVKYLSRCDHKYTSVDIDGNIPKKSSNYGGGMFVKCILCGHMPTIKDLIEDNL